MARYVEDGVLDFGLTGIDWVKENNADVSVSSGTVCGGFKETDVVVVLFGVHKYL